MYILKKPLKNISTPVGTEWKTFEDISFGFEGAIEVNLLIATGFIEEIVEKEFPQKGDIYFYICSFSGIHIKRDIWLNNTLDNFRKHTTGVYPTPALAQEALQKIKSKIK